MLEAELKMAICRSHESLLPALAANGYELVACRPAENGNFNHDRVTDMDGLCPGAGPLAKLPDIYAWTVSLVIAIDAALHRGQNKPQDSW